MIYHDRIYGPFEINAPVLLDLMQSAAMQRLHGVLQHGVSALVEITRPVTRFEHSLGVMALVGRLGAPLEEQIAAPALCADRLDYFFRDGLDLGLATPDEVQNVLNHLAVHGGRIVVDDVPAARWLGIAHG